MQLNSPRSTSVAVVAAFFLAVVISGCERKEKIIDIETPGGQIEVERSVDSGQVDVEVNDK